MAREEYEQAARLAHIEAIARDRLQSLVLAARKEQGSQPEVHGSAKVRTMAAIEDTLSESKRRLLSAEKRFARARLHALGPGIDEVTQPSEFDNGTAMRDWQSVASRLVDVNPRVVAADTGVRAVENEPVRWPIIGGLHASGPTLGVFYGKEHGRLGWVERHHKTCR